MRAAGFEVDVSPLLGDDYVAGLYAGRAPPGAVLRGYRDRLRAVRTRARYDLVWVEKEAWPWLPDIVERTLSDGRRRLVVDFDDAVFHRYDRHRNPLVRAALGHKLDRLMARADLVTAGNAYLAERARAAGSRQVAWLPTVIDLDRYPPPAPRRTRGPVVIGWMGSPSTAGYLHTVADAFSPLRAAGRIRCVAVGARPDQVQGTPFEAVPWSEASEVAALHGFDIGIMPLAQTAWELGKCGYKLIQYMACGLPVVASPVGANAQLVRDGENGLLATGLDDWATALRTLVDDPALRTRMGASGRRDVEAHYCLQVRAPRLIALLQALVSGADLP
ncbi:glycosyltransferase family 4 protein [Luteimonas sp. FCS-9]|uniref:glycosyltransferase family 4 protein n=1 Tax=Luteimonas sp. FCS-9 TaxID=1547516 RepID=UPI0018CDA028|nr:glycosyltransferase family 4 protein [Luteimonas sp. FCS-9]